MKQNGTTTIKWRFLFLIISLCFAIGCYISDPVPLGIYVIAIIVGIIDFPTTAWCWRNPNGIKSYCIHISQIIVVIIAINVTGIFTVGDYGICSFGFWHDLVFFFSLIASTFFLLLVVFKNSLMRYLEKSKVDQISP